MLNNIKVILCNTSHHGNIGAAARAMKTMGIMNLTLVSPLMMPDDHSIALASNAADVVINANITDNLDEALSDTTIAIGLTSRKREFTSNLATPKEILPEIFEQISQNNKVALVFGSEKNGLTIEQLEKCNRLVTIPGNPEYFSLNLAQAVQIICYEIYSNFNSSLSHLKQTVNLGSFADNQGILNHLSQVLQKTGYYKNSETEDKTKRRLQNIIHKAKLEREDVDLLRGILKTIERNLS